MIIAIDFDGTIVKHEYPSIGEPIPNAIETLKRLVLNGHELMLWTMRSGKELEEAVQYCKNNGIEFNSINENIEQQRTKWSTSNKQYASLYIDDAALGCPLILTNDRPYVDWDKVNEYLESMNIVDSGLGVEVGTVLAHRYLYYVCSTPVISDYEYDMLEKEAIKKKYKGYTKLLVPGSDCKDHYPFITPYTALTLVTKFKQDNGIKTNA